MSHNFYGVTVLSVGILVAVLFIDKMHLLNYLRVEGYTSPLGASGVPTVPNPATPVTSTPDSSAIVFTTFLMLGIGIAVYSMYNRSGRS